MKLLFKKTLKLRPSSDNSKASSVFSWRFIYSVETTATRWRQYAIMAESARWALARPRSRRSSSTVPRVVKLKPSQSSYVNDGVEIVQQHNRQCPKTCACVLGVLLSERLMPKTCAKEHLFPIAGNPLILFQNIRPSPVDLCSAIDKRVVGVSMFFRSSENVPL